jgi:hypothetical protein
MGTLRAVTIRTDEVEWSQIEGTLIADQLSYVSGESLEHALHGWSKPLVTELGPPPQGSLIKLALVASECSLKKGCGSWGRDCHPTSKKTPWCFEPTDHPSFAGQIVRWWRDGVYVLVVKS